MITQTKPNRAIFLILSLIILLFAKASLAGTSINFEVPAPPGGSLLDTKPLTLGGRDVMTSLYQSNKPQEEIVEYYHKFFEEQKFEKILDNKEKARKKRLIRFKKDDLVVSISIKPESKQTQVVIAKYLQPEGSLPPEKLRPSFKDSIFSFPKEDVAGEDLEIIPRPPESVRLKSTTRTNQTILMYTTSLPVDETKEFYNSKMPYQGWQLLKESNVGQAADAYKRNTGKKSLVGGSLFAGVNLDRVINDSHALDFSGSYGSARITIFPNFAGRELGSIVQIIYKEPE